MAGLYDFGKGDKPSPFDFSPRKKKDRSFLYNLYDNIAGVDDGVNSPGERLGKGVNDLAKGLAADPAGMAGRAAQAVKGDLDNLMFDGGAMERPADVLGYAAAPMAPGAANLLKRDPNVVNALNPNRRPDAYVGGHTAPTRDGYSAPLHSLAGDIYPDDIYSPQAAQYYGHGEPLLDRQTASILRKYKDKPDAMVDIHRAVPKGQTDINAGDWVTVNKAYAKQHGQSWLDDDYDIVTEKVPASELFTDGNSIHEFGWSPSAEKVNAMNDPVAAAKMAWEANPNSNELRKAYLAARNAPSANPAHKPSQGSEQDQMAQIRAYLEGKQ